MTDLRPLRHRPLLLALAFVVLGGLIGPDAAGAASPPIDMAPAEAYPTGQTGSASLDVDGTAVVDLDGDGHDDVVLIARWQGSSLTVLYGDGDGTLSSPQTIAAGTYNSNVIVGDFDEDGRPDVVVTGASSFVVVHNDGDRAFSVGTTYPLVQSPFQNSGLTALLDEDDTLDLALKTPSGIQTMIGGGDGTFTLGPLTTIPSSFPGGIASIAAADFDGDDAVDLVAGDAGAQVVSSLRGGGDGTFTLVSQRPVPFLPTTVLAGDLDGRGVDSVVVLPEANPPFATMAVLINEGGGTLGTPTYQGAGFGNPDGALVDLDGDGNLDVISTNTFTGDQVVLAGSGDGTFTDAGSFPTDWNAQTPGVGDFDEDGRPDVVVPAACPGMAGAFGQVCVSVLLNRS